MSKAVNNTISKREWQAFLALKKRIYAATDPLPQETLSQQKKRITKLLNNPLAFFQFYFPHYCQSPFGWFHKKAAKDVKDDPDIFLVAEWPREHAKSVFFDVMFPLYLLAKEELSGMILASANGDKAKTLLKDIQAELEDNRRFAKDFGEQKNFGNWTDGSFSPAQGVGFWGFGLRQSPVGVREAEKRPNYGVIDDSDDKRTAKNQTLTLENVDWVLGELYNCLSLQGSRVVFINNRVHPRGLTAHIVGDIEPGDPKREGITHIKVFASEDPKTHKLKYLHEGGVPAWKERYTPEMLQARINKIGERNALRQFYHQYVELGLIFKDKMIKWGKCPPLNKYDSLVSYNDPSWKRTGDYKAILLVGKKGMYYYVHWAWVRQATVSSMVEAHYIVHELTKEVNCFHYMEGGLMQDQHRDHYDQYAAKEGEALRLRIDKRKKPDKQDRIADLEPLFQAGKIIFNEKLRKDRDMQLLKNQLLGFPDAHDDAPDALEGAIYLLNRKLKTGRVKSHMGKMVYKSDRQV